MKTRFGGGSSSVGRRLKKSPQRRPHHRLHRRERTERAPAPLSHLGTAGTNAGTAISLQVEDAVGDGRGDVVELLLSALCRDHSQSAGHRVSHPFAAPHSRQAAHHLGRINRPSQPNDLGVHPPAARAIVGGVSSRLCAGAESGRVPVVALEATRVAKFLPAELWPAQPLCSQGSAPDAEAALAGDRLLAASGTISIVTILCNSQ